MPVWTGWCTPLLERAPLDLMANVCRFVRATRLNMPDTRAVSALARFQLRYGLAHASMQPLRHAFQRVGGGPLPAHPLAFSRGSLEFIIAQLIADASEDTFIVGLFHRRHRHRQMITLRLGRA